MKKTIILFAISLLLTGYLSAQQITGIAIFSKIGYHSLPGSGTMLNKIAPAGRGFTNNFIVEGLEGYFRTNKLILALDGNIGVQNAKSVDAGWTAAAAGAVYAKAGWLLIGKKNYWLYPSIGLGMAGMDMDTHNYVNDEVINLKNRSLATPSFDLGFNSDIIVNRITDHDGYGALLLGVRTGYRFSIKNCTWHDNDGKKLIDMPSYGYNGFYIMVTIGGGGFVTK